ncbi:hypothetical protein ACFY1P_27785 [Streptomyces sp. NPDC001407]|uniref:hypothetical protein n=1 Tax=Streptomyces sp. NPDC001407 TaxID=3364573 RepID=UPI0036BF484C
MNASPQQPSSPSPYGQSPAPMPAPAVPGGSGAGRMKRVGIPVVAGAVAASVVWGGALALSGGSSAKVPDVSGYRAVDDLCKDAVLRETGSLFTVKDGEPAVLRHDSMDRSECYREMAAKATSVGAMTVSTALTLHKKTNPGPEFIAEAERADYIPKSRTTVKKLPGLGDRAYVISTELEHARFLTISVLDGGAVFSMKVTGVPLSDEDKAGPYSTDKLEPLLVKDARATLTKLKG